MVIGLIYFLDDYPTIVDCGSNKGEFADIFIDEYGDNAKINLIEPNSKLLSFTEIKYEYRKNISYIKCAAYSVTGQVKQFYYFENFNNELSSIYKDDKLFEGLPLQLGVTKTVAIDDLFKEIDYLKIDVEGAEIDAILGCSELLHEQKIKIIQVEYSEHWARAGRKFTDLSFMFSETPYKIYRYADNNYNEVTDFENAPYDNYIITYFDIHNYCISGANHSFIQNTLDLPKMNLVIEVGVMEGLTTKYICDNLLLDNEDSRVIAVDPLFDFYVNDDPRYHQEFKHQYYRFKRNTRGLPVELYRGKSEDELPKLHSLRADMCYIDGNHYPPHPYIDGCWCFALTKEGGFILFDDWDMWDIETKASIDKFLDEFKGYYEIVKSNYQILIKKTMNYYNHLTEKYYE